MELRRTPIFGKVVWILIIAAMIMVGCGKKETPQPTAEIPATAIENTISTPTPEANPTAAIPTDTSVSQALPSSTTPPTLEPSPTTSPEIPPTETAAPAPAGMSLMDWTLWGWSSSNSPMACQDVKSPCWMLTDYRDSSSLDYADKITIDPAWKNPTLVFQNRYSIKEAKAFGYVEIQITGEAEWNRVYTLKGSRDYWHEVTIDLSKFSGKTISLRFATKPYVNIVQSGEATKMVYNKQTWIIQNINIVSK
jgi:hypothetical protein